MRVHLYTGSLALVRRSGVGQAVEHQRAMLQSAGVEVVTDWSKPADAVHINTVLPDAPLAALRARLRGRGTESEEAIAGRLKRAEEELPYAREYDFSVENRDVDACADEIYRILKQRQQD